MYISSDFDMNLVRLFVTIIDTGTLSEAAKRHGVTRSQVSKNLKKLEELFGTQLIRRSTRRLELTQQGEVLYQHGIGMLQEIELAKEEILWLGSEPMGFVRLSVPTGIGETILLPILIEFQKKYPKLSLQVMFSNRVNDLIESQVDVAIKVLTNPPDDYVAKKITDVTWMLCATPYYLQKNNISIADMEKFANYDFLCPSNKLYETLNFTNGMEDFKVKINIKLRSENFRCLLGAARNDLGIALLPSYMFEEDITRGVLQEVDPSLRFSGLDSSLYILTTSRPHLSSAGIKVLTSYLLENLEEIFK